MQPAITRRTFAAAAATWALGPRPAAAVPSSFQRETDLWTGSVLLDAAGNSFVLRDLRRPLTLLKLWANWCPACAVEMPHLATLAAELGQGVEIILVSHPQYWAADQAMARRQRLPFRLATFDPSNPSRLVEQALLGPEREYAVPQTLAFRERDRSIVLKHESATDWAAPASIRQIKSLIA